MPNELPRPNIEDLRRGHTTAADATGNQGGRLVAGISVNGARHLAATRGGLKHRLVASTEKRGTLLILRTYPHEATPMATTVQVVPALEQERDFYSVVVEMTDTVRRYTLQVEWTEGSYGVDAAGFGFKKANLELVARAEAFRNAVLEVLPQEEVQSFNNSYFERLHSTDELAPATSAAHHQGSQTLRQGATETIEGSPTTGLGQTDGSVTSPATNESKARLPRRRKTAAPPEETTLPPEPEPALPPAGVPDVAAAPFANDEAGGFGQTE